MTPHPALSWLLTYTAWQLGPPDGCAECPFATPSPGEPAPNPDDPDEGRYDCALIDAVRVWGETPQCDLNAWLTRAREELDQLQLAAGDDAQGAP